MKTFLLVLLLNVFSPVQSLAESQIVKPRTQPLKSAVFAGGCFWCMQPPYDALKDRGVISAIVGYTGGATANPTYEQISTGTTGHREVIQVNYDPQKISFQQLLEVFWKNIDPYDGGGQFCDKGEQYSSAVYYSDASEKKEIDDSLRNLEKNGIKIAKIATKVLPLKTFYAGEDYHQSYYIKNPVRYKYYRLRCGRDVRLKEVWDSKAKP